MCPWCALQVVRGAVELVARGGVRAEAAEGAWCPHCPAGMFQGGNGTGGSSSSIGGGGGGGGGPLPPPAHLLPELPPGFILPSAVQTLFDWSQGLHGHTPSALPSPLSETELAAFELLCLSRLAHTPGSGGTGTPLPPSPAAPHSPALFSRRAAAPLHMRRCPAPECGILLAVDAHPDAAWLSCGSCGEWLCGCCGEPWVAPSGATHTAFTCAAFRAHCEARDGREAAATEVAAGVGGERGKSCPRCGETNTRGRGHACHSVHCGKCAQNFCYVCCAPQPCPNECPGYCGDLCDCAPCTGPGGCAPGRPCAYCQGGGDRCPTCADEKAPQRASREARQAAAQQLERARNPRYCGPRASMGGVLAAASPPQLCHVLGMVRSECDFVPVQLLHGELSGGRELYTLAHQPCEHLLAPPPPDAVRSAFAELRLAARVHAPRSACMLADTLRLLARLVESNVGAAELPRQLMTQQMWALRGVPLEGGGAALLSPEVLRAELGQAPCAAATLLEAIAPHAADSRVAEAAAELLLGLGSPPGGTASELEAQHCRAKLLACGGARALALVLPHFAAREHWCAMVAAGLRVHGQAWRKCGYLVNCGAEGRRGTALALEGLTRMVAEEHCGADSGGSDSSAFAAPGPAAEAAGLLLAGLLRTAPRDTISPLMPRLARHFFSAAAAEDAATANPEGGGAAAEGRTSSLPLLSLLLHFLTEELETEPEPLSSVISGTCEKLEVAVVQAAEAELEAADREGNGPPSAAAALSSLPAAPLGAPTPTAQRTTAFVALIIARREAAAGRRETALRASAALCGSGSGGGSGGGGCEPESSAFLAEVLHWLLQRFLSSCAQGGNSSSDGSLSDTCECLSALLRLIAQLQRLALQEKLAPPLPLPPLSATNALLAMQRSDAWQALLALGMAAGQFGGLRAARLPSGAARVASALRPSLYGALAGCMPPAMLAAWAHGNYAQCSMAHSALGALQLRGQAGPLFASLDWGTPPPPSPPRVAWTCPACTLRNLGEACEACDEARPSREEGGGGEGGDGGSEVEEESEGSDGSEGIRGSVLSQLLSTLSADSSPSWRCSLLSLLGTLAAGDCSCLPSAGASSGGGGGGGSSHGLWPQKLAASPLLRAPLLEKTVAALLFAGTHCAGGLALAFAVLRGCGRSELAALLSRPKDESDGMKSRAAHLMGSLREQPPGGSFPYLQASAVPRERQRMHVVQHAPGLEGLKVRLAIELLGVMRGRCTAAVAMVLREQGLLFVSSIAAAGGPGGGKRLAQQLMREGAALLAALSEQ